MTRVLAGSVLLLAACGGPDRDSAECTPPAGALLEAPCACAQASAEIGGGERSFEPLDEGDPLVMVHGPQGGWHVLASLRVRNMLDIVDIAYVIDVLPDGPSISDQTYRVQLVDEGGCSGVYPGMYGYLDVDALAEGEADTPPELLVGRTLRLSLEAADAEGRTASDTLEGVAAPDPIDVADTGLRTPEAAKFSATPAGGWGTRAEEQDPDRGSARGRPPERIPPAPPFIREYP